jgi:hypothetical protein
MTGHFSWYDSGFLSTFHAIGTRCPHMLDEVVEATNILRTPPGFRARMVSLFDSPTHEYMVRRADYLFKTGHRTAPHELEEFGRHVIHDDEIFTRIQRGLVDRVSLEVGEPVEMTYNFLNGSAHGSSRGQVHSRPPSCVQHPMATVRERRGELAHSRTGTDQTSCVSRIHSQGGRYTVVFRKFTMALSESVVDPQRISAFGILSLRSPGKP